MSATEARPQFQLPASKQECQLLLREHGHTGLKIQDIEGDRLYCMTKPQYHREHEDEEGSWLRQACTVIFTRKDDGTLHTTRLDGWVV